MKKMRKTISVKWLRKNNACEAGVEWFSKQKETNAIRLIEKLIRTAKEKRNNVYLFWAEWIILTLTDWGGPYWDYREEENVDLDISYKRFRKIIREGVKRFVSGDGQ